MQKVESMHLCQTEVEHDITPGMILVASNHTLADIDSQHLHSELPTELRSHRFPSLWGRSTPILYKARLPMDPSSPFFCSTHLSNLKFLISRMADMQDSLYETSSHLETMPDPDQRGIPSGDPKSSDAADPNNSQVKS
jgi:hypothetical protein